MKTKGSINNNTWKQNALFLAPNITCISLFLWSWTLQSYQINWSLYQLYSSFLSKEKCNCLSHVVMVTLDVRDRDVSTAYCQSYSGDEVDWVRVTHMLQCSAVIGWDSTAAIGAIVAIHIRSDTTPWDKRLHFSFESAICYDASF